MRPVHGMVAVAIVAALALGTGCAYGNQRTPVSMPPALLFSLHRAPLQVDFDATPRGRKTGESNTHYLAEPLFGVPIFAWGDASVEQAKAQGGLETVHFADYEVFNILGIYREFTVRVYGE